MSRYRLEFKTAALKDVKKLDSVNKKRMLAKLRFFVAQDDPPAFAKSLKDTFAGSYHWRVGNYRIVFDVDGDTIIILRVQHRSEVYRH